MEVFPPQSIEATAGQCRVQFNCFGIPSPCGDGRTVLLSTGGLEVCGEGGTPLPTSVASYSDSAPSAHVHVHAGPDFFRALPATQCDRRTASLPLV